MRIVWDLDGVIRDLNGYIIHLYGGKYPKVWDYICGNNKNIYQTINENIDILREAPPTAYYKVLKKHYTYPEFWTSQPKHWQPHTSYWLTKHIGAHKVRFLKCAEKEVELRKDNDIVLIEDSPNFKSYDNIMLIDRPYNQEVKGAIRIFGTKHLNNLLNVIKGDTL